MLNDDQFQPSAEEGPTPPAILKRIQAQWRDSGMSPSAFIAASGSPAEQKRAQEALASVPDPRERSPLSERGLYTNENIANAINTIESTFGLEFGNPSELGGKDTVSFRIDDLPTGTYNPDLPIDPAGQNIGPQNLTRMDNEGNVTGYSPSSASRRGRSIRRSLQNNDILHVQGMDAVENKEGAVTALRMFGQFGDIYRSGGGGSTASATGVASGTKGRHLFEFKNLNGTPEMVISPAPGSFWHTALANEVVNQEGSGLEHPRDLSNTYLSDANDTTYISALPHALRDGGMPEDEVEAWQEERFKSLRDNLARQTLTPEGTNQGEDPDRVSLNPSRPVGRGMEGSELSAKRFNEVNRRGNWGTHTEGWVRMLTTDADGKETPTGVFHNLLGGTTHQPKSNSRLSNSFANLHGSYNRHDIGDDVDTMALTTTPNQQKEQAKATEEANKHYPPNSSGEHYDAGTDEIVLASGKRLQFGDLAGAHVEKFVNENGLRSKPSM